MKRQRYTYHNGNAVDITEDMRPSCWETSSELPFRTVKDSYSELIVYVYHILMLTSVSSSLKNPHVNFAALLMHLISMHCKLQGIPLFMPKDRED